MRFLLVYEEAVIQFAYWNDGVCQGMRYAGDLFEYVSSFALEQRLDAYSAGNELLDQGATVCVTVAQGRYSVWKSLRCSPP